ncbi:MAG TPA: universal stress protein, partial [Candidatus Sulfotelmatobacter sp.]|nr:universal stress protein [Candidatus Sulfotelmatobacter sp.]
MKSTGFDRIVLATDGSEQARAALALTTSIAVASTAQVRVVHVWSLEVHHRHGVWDVEMRREAEALIDETVTALREAGVDATGEIRRADRAHVAASIAEAARAFDADLVVVGSRGLPDWQAMVQHSTSHQLLESVDAPVLIVRAQPPAVGHEGHRVALAIAGGDDVRPGVQAAIAAASAPNSEILVVHVAQAIIGVQGFAYVEPDEEIQQTLGLAKKLIQDAGIAVTSVVAQAGPVAHVLAGVAASWDADLIVVGG